MVNILSHGDRYYHLVVQELFETVMIGHGHTMHKYLCKCDCGNEIVVSQGELVGGHIRSCGCVTHSRVQPLKYNLIGQRFGRLIVLQQADTWWSDSGKSRMIRWECICDCGNKVIVNSRALRIGSTVSCGCYHKKRVSEALTLDLTNQRFGYLTVLERAGSYERNGKKSGIMALWKCRCDCGNTIVTTGFSLRCGDTISCGCARTSLAEMCVNDFLNNLGYVINETYFREKTFPDLISKYGGFLRFDFVVMTPNGMLCIECQGKQHYVSVPYFGGDEQFYRRVENDNHKRQWCKDHNVKLVEIPYTAHSTDEIIKYIAELVN